MRRLSLLLGFSVLLALWPLAPAGAHALPVSYDPLQNAALTGSPAQVRIRFSEHLNADISRIVVVNPSNQRVDSNDSAISDDGYTIAVGLPALAAGTYVVAWRSHSADDGHVTGGSYIFHVKQADGTIPPLSGPLPSGNIVGGGGTAMGALDAPTILQTLAHWAALAALTLLLGLIFWWSFIIPRQGDGAASQGAAFRQVADIALETIIVATLVEVALQAVILDGSARGLVSWPRISSILFHSRQGIFLLTRTGLAALGLVAIWTPALRTSLTVRNLRRVLPLCGVLLAVAFVFSGHGGAAPVWWGAVVDLVHLLTAGVWLGGIGTLAWLVLPALEKGSAAERERYLATNLPAFSVPALIAAATLAITGSLNADARMTSLSQLWTTPYGIVLTIKITLFLVMAGISYVHAFRLRPQLAAQLGMPAPALLSAEGPGNLATFVRNQLALLQASPTRGEGALALGGAVAAPHGSEQGNAEQTSGAIARLLRAEATLGMGVLLCAALLSPLAGTLAPTQLAGASFGATGGNQSLTQTVDGHAVTLAITPGKFGPNTVTVTVKNPDGTLASAGTVFIVATMQEMDMGVNEFDLMPGTAPGTYTGSIVLAMGGHWNLQTVIRTKQDPQNLHRVTFTVSAAF